MERELLNQARLNPEKNLLWNCDPRLGESGEMSWMDLENIMEYYGITIRELHRYDIRSSSEERRPYGE